MATTPPKLTDRKLKLKLKPKPTSAPASHRPIYNHAGPIIIIIILHVLLIAAIVLAALSAHDVALTSQRLVKNTETNVVRGSAGVKYNTHTLTLDVVLQRLDREMGIRKGENATERVARRIRFLKERLERRRIAREREAGGGARVVQG